MSRPMLANPGDDRLMEDGHHQDWLKAHEVEDRSSNGSFGPCWRYDMRGRSVVFALETAEVGV
jgi:hypothetical protein